jgi:hypothetical protein
MNIAFRFDRPWRPSAEVMTMDDDQSRPSWSSGDGQTDLVSTNVQPQFLAADVAVAERT